MTETQRDEMLISISNAVQRHDEMLTDMSATLKKHDEILVDLVKEVHNIKEEQVSQREDMTKMGKTLTAELVSQREDMTKMGKTLGAELVRQRKNMAKMEHDLGEKIDALFDVKEICYDKFAENDENIKSIRDNLDLHDIRLLALESKAN